MKWIFKDEQKRSKLGEGRNYGVGFAFCRRVKNLLTTIQPISPCKDYLNDVVYSELTGKPFKAYGLSTKKEDIFTEQGGFLVFSVCLQGPSSLTKYPNFDRDCQALDKNYKELQKFIQFFEEKFKLLQLTEITKLGDNLFLAKVPKFWLQGTYRISLYSLLIRVGISFNGDKSPMDFLKSFTSDTSDQYLIVSALPKIDKMLNGNIPEQPFSSYNNSNVHSNGIVAFNF